MKNFIRYILGLKGYRAVFIPKSADPADAPPLTRYRLPDGRFQNYQTVLATLTYLVAMKKDSVHRHARYFENPKHGRADGSGFYDFRVESRIADGTVFEIFEYAGVIGWQLNNMPKDLMKEFTYEETRS